VHEANTEFLENVKKEIYVPIEKVDSLEKALVELTNNAIRIEQSDTEFVVVDGDKLIVQT
ncbi:MAG: DUF1949 domain-containing protein, partial [Alkaliphilus sp.]